MLVYPDVKALEHLVKDCAIAPITKVLINHQLGRSAQACGARPPQNRALKRTQLTSSDHKLVAIRCGWAHRRCLKVRIVWLPQATQPLLVADFTEFRRRWRSNRFRTIAYSKMHRDNYRVIMGYHQQLNHQNRTSSYAS